MTRYRVDTQGVRTALLAVGAEGEVLAEARATTGTSFDEAATACAQSAGVGAAVGRVAYLVHDGQDAVERHVAACVAAMVEAATAYEVADALMAGEADDARAAAGDGWEAW